MILTACNICKNHLDGATNQLDHFCERCQPFAEEYLKEREAITMRSFMQLKKEIESFRGRFLQTRVLPGQKLKAV